jgi:hypothetical protein
MAIDSEDIVARHKAGNAAPNVLNDEIVAAWRELLSNPAGKADAARLLGVPEDKLLSEQPPFEAEQIGSGLTGGEVIIVLTASFAVGFAKEVGGQLGKDAARRLRELWIEYMSDRVSPPGSNKLGTAKD